MVRQSIRYALLFGAITAAAVSPARAHGTCNSGCGTSAPCAPATRTITTWESVPETYTVKRTSYKVECRTEEYDTFRCESVPEVRERTVKVMKRVPVTTTEIRKVAHKVTVNEERTVMKNSYRTVQETVMQKKLVRLGHWETREVPALFGNGLFGGHGHGCKSSCGDPCATSCPKTRCKKVWVHCPEYTCCPVTVCKKVCVQECVKCVVPVCKTEWREEAVQVCSFKCVEECRTEKYTVCVTRKIACKATRTVRVCVPVEENVTCTRMVRKCVTREVACAAPAAPACGNACGNDCGNACGNTCCKPSLRDRLNGLFAKHNRCNADCCR